MRSLIIFVTVIIILGLIGATLWFYFVYKPTHLPGINNGDIETPQGYTPLNNNGPFPTNNQGSSTTPTNTSISTSSSPAMNNTVPIMRNLSSTPIGGFGVKTTMPTRTGKVGTTTVRWIDRGRGNVFETIGGKLEITTVSNTLLPRVNMSWWNSNINAFVAQYTNTTNDTITTVTANIIKNSTSTSPKNASSTKQDTISETPYELKGSIISGNIIGIAKSPTGDKIVTIINDNNRAIGYVSKFDGSGNTRLFSIPLTQIVVEWPESNTIVITTKASAYFAGYLYFVNVKTGSVKQVLGGIPGLSARVSADAKQILYSSTGKSSNPINTYLYDRGTGKTKEIVFKTLAEKCVWSQKIFTNVYCAVPSQIESGIYPDDWYLGKNTFNDNLWLFDTKTENARKITDFITNGNALIDSYNIQTDSIDNYLFLMNKKDLSFWSIDLIASDK